MRLSVPATRSARRLLPLLAASLFLAVLTGPAAVQAAGTTTSTTVRSRPGRRPRLRHGHADHRSSRQHPARPARGQPGQTAIVPPAAVQVPLNPGWKTDQMDVRVMPEYDQKAVLVIVGFSLPADVPLPATLKFPIPAGAKITGIGEVDPNGNFTYNYTTSYPPVEPGTDWDIATIEVKNYRQLQIDYYYDPGLPQGAGQRSFPLLTQMPLDVGTVAAARAAARPGHRLQGRARPSRLGHRPTTASPTGWGRTPRSRPVVLWGTSSPTTIQMAGFPRTRANPARTQVSTNTVLLAAILIVVICIGALVVYRSVLQIQ